LTFRGWRIRLQVEHVHIDGNREFNWGNKMDSHDFRLIDYLVYLVASVVLTVWVGNTLFKNGRPFLVSVFQEAGLADSVNRLLVVGFYLVNLGAAALLINAGGAPATVGDMIQETVTRIGVVLLVLGLMHFSNMLVFKLIRRPLHQRPAPPPPYFPGAQVNQPVAGA
jgi:hypothetical protein